MFSGSIPALVTPIRDGAIDEKAFRALVDWQIESGSSALVPCGTTGESATMTIEEHDRVVRVCIEQAAGRVPVIAGCGSNDTAVALHHMELAKAAGADAALIVPPYYNRPNQEGVLAHFRALAAGCDLPIMLYNVPARTIVDISVETMGELAKLPTVIGVKDATGNAARVSAQRERCGKDFIQLSGNDDMALGFMAMGGVGASRSPPMSRRAMRRFPEGVRGGAVGRCARAAGQAVSAPHGLVHRCLARADQIRHGQGPARFPDRIAPADDAAERGQPGGGGCRARACGDRLRGPTSSTAVSASVRSCSRA